MLLKQGGQGPVQIRLLPPPAVTSVGGFVLASSTATLAGLGTRLTVLIGLVYGIGIFYVSEPDATYAASGLKIASYNMTHYVGLGLIGFTMIFFIRPPFFLPPPNSSPEPPPQQHP